MHPTLRGYAVAVLETAAAEGAAAEVAAELGQVTALVAGNDQLATTLSDVAVPRPARRAVLADLLTGRVLPATVQLVTRVVEVERAPEVLPALHDVTELARAEAERVEGETVVAEEPVLGSTGHRQLLAGYAAAVLHGLDVAQLEAVEDELFRLTRIVESHDPLRRALADRNLPLDHRRQVLDDLLRNKVHPATLRLAVRAISGRVRDIVGNLDWMVEQVATARGWRLARVRTARAIGADEQRQVADALAQLIGQPVELQVSLDPDLLGGAVIEVGDLLIDASARHRLDQLHDVLLGSEGATRGAKT